MDDRRWHRVLRQHVETERLLGLEAVPVGERAAVEVEASGTRSVAEAAPPRGCVGSVERREPTDSIRGLQSVVPVGERAAALAAVEAELAADERVRVLQPAGTKLVFGEGSVEAEIMFVGEAPGETEDRLGRPFVGPAGELLDKMIVAMGLSRQSVYIINTVQFRPPGNRTPTPEETSVCMPYAVRAMEIIRPQAIVTLGGSSTKSLLDTATGITRLRGQWQMLERVNPPIPLMPTFHPAYLLRSYTKENRQRVWADLQAVMERVGLKAG
ncbi:MAG: uracil-DNA glycosylase [Planctomycetota bacterium]